MTPALRRLAVNLTLGIVSLFISLIFIELALRAIIPLDTGTSFEHRTPHPVLGWSLEPNASYYNQLREETVLVRYNAGGWRDVEHTIEKPEGVFRILILGDSFMEAYSVGLEDTVARRIERLARESGYPIEVINLGVGGYGTLQEYLAFQEVGWRYKPDLVLLGFYLGNDLTDNSLELSLLLGTEGMKTNCRPFLIPSEATVWKVTQVDFEDCQRRYETAQANRNTLGLYLLERSAFLRLVNTNIETMGMSLESSSDQENTPESINRRERQELAVLGVNYCVESPEYTRAWDVTERILARLKKDVEAVGSELIIFTVPAPRDASIQHQKRVEINALNPDRLCLDEAPGFTRFSHMLTKLDVSLIDLFPDFSGVTREEGIELFQRSDGHWNPEGHALAAKRIISELIDRELMPVSEH